MQVPASKSERQAQSQNVTNEQSDNTERDNYSNNSSMVEDTSADEIF